MQANADGRSVNVVGETTRGVAAVGRGGGPIESGVDSEISRESRGLGHAVHGALSETAPAASLLTDKHVLLAKHSHTLTPRVEGTDPPVGREAASRRHLALSADRCHIPCTQAHQIRAAKSAQDGPACTGSTLNELRLYQCTTPISFASEHQTKATKGTKSTI